MFSITTYLKSILQSNQSDLCHLPLGFFQTEQKMEGYSPRQALYVWTVIQAGT